MLSQALLWKLLDFQKLLITEPEDPRTTEVHHVARLVSHHPTDRADLEPGEVRRETNLFAVHKGCREVPATVVNLGQDPNRGAKGLSKASPRELGHDILPMRSESLPRLLW